MVNSLVDMRSSWRELFYFSVSWYLTIVTYNYNMFISCKQREQSKDNSTAQTTTDPGKYWAHRLTNKSVFRMLLAGEAGFSEQDLHLNLYED